MCRRSSGSIPDPKIDPRQARGGSGEPAAVSEGLNAGAVDENGPLYPCEIQGARIEEGVNDFFPTPRNRAVSGTVMTRLTVLNDSIALSPKWWRRWTAQPTRQWMHHPSFLTGKSYPIHPSGALDPAKHPGTASAQGAGIIRIVVTP